MATIVTCDYCGNRAIGRYQIAFLVFAPDNTTREWQLGVDVCGEHAKKVRAELPRKKE